MVFDPFTCLCVYCMICQSATCFAYYQWFCWLQAIYHSRDIFLIVLFQHQCIPSYDSLPCPTTCVYPVLVVTVSLYNVENVFIVFVKLWVTSVHSVLTTVETAEVPLSKVLDHCHRCALIRRWGNLPVAICRKKISIGRYGSVFTCNMQNTLQSYSHLHAHTHKNKTHILLMVYLENLQMNSSQWFGRHRTRTSRKQLLRWVFFSSDIDVFQSNIYFS